MKKLARDKNGNLVSIDNAKSGITYFDEKGHELVVKRTKYASFFSKKNQNVKESEAESNEHKQAKLFICKLYEEINQKPVMEYKINKKQRADVFVPSHKVIEVQCSMISLNKLRKRHLGYQKSGMQDIWLLGKKYNQNQKRIYPFCYFNEKLGFHFWKVDYLKQELQCIYNVTNDKKTWQNFKITSLKNKIELKKQNVYKYNLEKILQKEKLSFRYASSWQRKVREEWYIRNLDFFKYLPYLVLPTSVPTISKYEEYMLKSYILWKSLKRQDMIDEKYCLPFIESKFYQRLFEKAYAKQIKKVKSKYPKYIDVKISQIK